MIYVPIPIERIAFGKPLPVNVWDSKGNLLLRKGQAIRSEQHREALRAHQACAIEADYKAWQRSYDRLVYTLLREGASVRKLPRPACLTQLPTRTMPPATTFTETGWMCRRF
ncbi:MAG: hypothetical protein IPO43_06025 [Rhodoferax sp.]|nr:hypothetical protein [Rhodoferax sp.]